jgi:excisionase family DNA binding protein
VGGTVKFWSVEDLAEYLGVPRTWIYDRTRANGPEMIPHIKLGKYVRFNPESRAFQDWLEGHEVRPVVGATTQRCF